MQQFYKNVVDSKLFGYKIEFLSRNGVSLLRIALTRSEVVFFSFSVEKLSSTYIEKAWAEPSKHFRDFLCSCVFEQGYFAYGWRFLLRNGVLFPQNYVTKSIVTSDVRLSI